MIVVVGDTEGPDDIDVMTADGVRYVGDFEDRIKANLVGVTVQMVEFRRPLTEEERSEGIDYLPLFRQSNFKECLEVLEKWEELTGGIIDTDDLGDSTHDFRKEGF